VGRPAAAVTGGPAVVRRGRPGWSSASAVRCRGRGRSRSGSPRR
jgi:hypothetical protein